MHKQRSTVTMTLRCRHMNSKWHWGKRQHISSLFKVDCSKPVLVTLFRLYDNWGTKRKPWCWQLKTFHVSLLSKKQTASVLCWDRSVCKHCVNVAMWASVVYSKYKISSTLSLPQLWSWFHFGPENNRRGLGASKWNGNEWRVHAGQGSKSVAHWLGLPESCKTLLSFFWHSKMSAAVPSLG